MTHPLQIWSCSVHVRPARRCRPTQPPRSPPGSAGRRRRRTQPHRAPPHPRPHADRLRPAPGRRAATTHLRDRPRRHHAALRHHRHRRNRRAHHPRPASRRRARGQADQPPHPRAGHTGHPDRPIPSPAARRPTRGRQRRRGRTTHRPSAHARGHRGRDPPPPGRRRSRRYLSRPGDRAEQPAVAGTLRGHHQLRRQSRHPARGHLRPARPG